ncbi:MAG: cytochrome c biogenesis protein CcdA [Pseudomonadota bacterium]
MGEIGLFTAFLGGLLSFLSPCVLPLAPPYLAYMAGTTLDQVVGDEDGAEPDAAIQRRVLIGSVFFVAGLATVFVALGATASLVGQTLAQWRYEFGIVAGFVIFALGAHFIGFRRAPWAAAAVIAVSVLLALPGGLVAVQDLVARHGIVLAALLAFGVALSRTGYDNIPFLMGEARFDAGSRAGSHAGAYVIGLAFAFGWTPCIGPILGSILFLAAQEETISAGVTMLSVYALGLGTPFILAAAFVRPFLRWARGFRRHMGRVEAGMGGLLVVVGAMMVTGTFETLAFWLLDTFPALAVIG